jgi:hypothetical protein
MLIATMHDALPLFGLGGLLIAGAVLLDLGAVWMIRAAAVRRRVPPLGRLGVAAVLALGSLPVWAYGLFAALIGWAAVGCAPDAYECPL